MAESLQISIEYDQLTKHQKLAVFMIVVGVPAAAEILKGFEDHEVELICQEIANYPLIDAKTRGRVIEEFAGVIGEGVGSDLGGSMYALRALEKAKGDYKAANIIGRIAPATSALEVLNEISEMEPRQIYNLIKKEQPQTVAFIISHLTEEKAGAILTMLPAELREVVAERIGIMETTSTDLVSKVVHNLKKHMVGAQRQTTHMAGGIKMVANLVSSMDKEVSKALLVKLEERNPSLGAAIRKKLFSFDDLTRLQLPDLQRILREVEMADLVVALKSANPTLQQMIMSGVSKRAAETLKDEIAMLGPVKLKDVEAAQDRIIQVVRRLEDAGEISTDQSGGDRVVG
jgi:flagellar motor switch protein FliG